MLASYMRLLRVYQYPKNLLVFGALIFAQELYDPAQTLRAAAAFVVFCLASSAAYILNDIHDREENRAHPAKRHRPLPSGAVSVRAAWLLCGGLIAAGVVPAYVLGPAFAVTVLTYLMLMAAYTYALKQVLIVDVLSIAFGFVLRAIGGAVVLDVHFSNWLVVCTLFLALFLALGKRRCECAIQPGDRSGSRPARAGYTLPYLDGLMLVVGAAALLAYTVYTCAPEVVDRIGTDKLYVTVPLVVYGLARYLFLVHQGTGGSDPSRMLLTDVPLLVTVLMWGVACIGILHLGAGGSPVVP